MNNSKTSKPIKWLHPTAEWFEEPKPITKGFATREEYERYAKWVLERATDLMLLAHTNPKAIPRVCKQIEAGCRRKADRIMFITIRKKPNPAAFLIGTEHTLIPILEKALADGS